MSGWAVKGCGCMPRKRGGQRWGGGKKKRGLRDEGYMDGYDNDDGDDQRKTVEA